MWFFGMMQPFSLWLFDDAFLADYGQKDNTDLAERFGVKVTDDYKDHPVIKLFVPDRDGPIDYDGDYSLDSLRKFVATEGGILEMELLFVNGLSVCFQVHVPCILRSSRDGIVYEFWRALVLSGDMLRKNYQPRICYF